MVLPRKYEREDDDEPAQPHPYPDLPRCRRRGGLPGPLDRSPATHLRLPHVYRDETTTLGLDRHQDQSTAVVRCVALVLHFHT